MIRQELNILVLGKNGQVARSIFNLAENSKHKFLFLSSAEVNLSDLESIENVLNRYQFDVLINCAAYTAVDQAEIDREIAYKINALAVSKLAIYCESKNAKLIHFSSDYVYGDMGTNLLDENSSTNPVNYYGYTKLEGERFILASGCRHLILRTSWVYAPWGANFVRTMLKLGKSMSEIRVVSDQIGSPTYSIDLAQAVLSMLDKWSDKEMDGVYNIAGSTICSWYEFSSEIFKLAMTMNYNLQVNKIKPILTKDYPTRANRSLNSRMSQDKLMSVFDIIMPTMSISLKNCLGLIKTESATDLYY